MMNEKNEPKLVSEDNVLGKKYEHPSWGVIQVSRVSGQKQLLGSNLKHQHFVTLNIGRGKKYIGDSGEERIHGGMRGELIEVALSEAQWAQLLSSMNMGSGVPCTLTYINKERMPECPEDDVRERFHRTVQADVAGFANNLNKLQREIAARFEDPKALTKVEKKEILSKLDSVLTELQSNMPFVLEMFEEKLEQQVAAAKTDIDSFLAYKAQLLGMKDLQEHLALNEGDARELSPGNVEEG